MIVRFLKWALSKFDDKKPDLEAWPFPAPVEKPKTKPRVAKATTRPAKKATAVKKTVKKAK